MRVEVTAGKEYIKELSAQKGIKLTHSTQSEG